MDRQELYIRLKKETSNFNTHIVSSTLMAGDNYHSGEAEVDGVKYYFAKYKNKCRVWNRKADYMDLLNNKKDYILNIDLD